jgi:hypothetical protein
MWNSEGGNINNVAIPFQICNVAENITCKSISIGSRNTFYVTSYYVFARFAGRNGSRLNEV